MALIKDFETPFKVTASYWKVGAMSIDTNLKDAHFTMSLYVDKAAGKEKDAFLSTQTICDLMGPGDKTLFDKYFLDDTIGWQKACYEYAKNHVPFFMDAKDDPDEQLKQQAEEQQP